MQNFKLMVDLLSSVSALVAIVAVLVAWGRGRRRPVEILRAIISPRSNRMRAFVELKNTKPYPVTVIGFSCYRRKLYQVQRQRGERPRLYPAFDVSDRLFIHSESVELMEFGQFTGEFHFDRSDFDKNAIIFRLHTSHGYFDVKPKDVLVFSEETTFIPEGTLILKKSCIWAARIAFIKGYIWFLGERTRRKTS